MISVGALLLIGRLNVKLFVIPCPHLIAIGHCTSGGSPFPNDHLISRLQHLHVKLLQSRSCFNI